MCANIRKKFRMNYLPLTLYLMSLLNTVFTSLPAPVNVHVDSLNFRHILRWEPGPETPKACSPCRRLVPHVFSLKFRLKEKNLKYTLTVIASYNGTLSPQRKVYFTPFKHTHLGPPQVTLAGCGNCIKINISLPEAEKEIQETYDPEFKIAWKKRGGDKPISIKTPNKNFTLDNLVPGTKYCIQVTLETYLNENVIPSNWSCIDTSMLEPPRGAVSAVLITVFSVVIVFVFSLYYTGFICKLKAALPRFLTMVLIQDYTLTPERTIPDQIFINSETDRQKNRSVIPQPATGGAHSDEEDEEQEEDEDQAYMNRDNGLSSGIGSCQESCDVSGSSKPVASVDSGNLSDRMSAEVEAEEECDAQGEGAEDSFISGRSQTGDTNELEEVETEEVWENSGSVNLFSVTLAALDGHKEEEEEEEEEEEGGARDFLKSDLESLLPRDTKHTQGLIDSQTETQSDDLKASDFNETGYEGKWTDTRTYSLQNCQTQREEEEEEEEEEEFSGYMSHR
uniref:Fibronectin type-III domain-containing protein n=1 Tax=Sphaeramia orbicularis TaxID=375764 RepID=A0A672YFD8_9TELE